MDKQELAGWVEERRTPLRKVAERKFPPRRTEESRAAYMAKLDEAEPAETGVDDRFHPLKSRRKIIERRMSDLETAVGALQNAIYDLNVILVEGGVAAPKQSTPSQTEPAKEAPYTGGILALHIHQLTEQTVSILEDVVSLADRLDV